jgi:hypothetical protein
MIYFRHKFFVTIQRGREKVFKKSIESQKKGDRIKGKKNKENEIFYEGVYRG